MKKQLTFWICLWITLTYFDTRPLQVGWYWASARIKNAWGAYQYAERPDCVDGVKDGMWEICIR